MATIVGYGTRVGVGPVTTIGIGAPGVRYMGLQYSRGWGIAPGGAALGPVWWNGLDVCGSVGVDGPGVVVLCAFSFLGL